MNRFITPLLSVLIVACASTPDRFDYSGATPTPPAYTPAGAGAPARGQPGSVGPDGKRVPRNDDPRMLPPGPPGVFAASKRKEQKVTLLRPPGVMTEEWEECADWLAAVIANPEELHHEIRALLASLTERGAACVRERVLYSCVLDSGNARPGDARSVLERRAEMQKFVDAMDRRLALACEGVSGKGTPVNRVSATLQSYGQMKRWQKP